MAGLLHFTTRDAGGHKRYDREKLADWAKERFNVELSIDDLRNKQRDEIRELLIDHSQGYAQKATEAMAEAESWLERIFDEETTPRKALREAEENGTLENFPPGFQRIRLRPASG